MKSLALYLHLPFCKQRCRYCDFFSTTGKEELIPAYRRALTEELYRQKTFWLDSSFSSVFFGGGTPSLWPAEELGRVLQAIKDTGRLWENAEITLEANPGAVDLPKLKMFKEVGVNRISLGVQSGEDRLLRAVGRIHTVADAERAVRQVRAAGFDNLNLDLIFGLPGQTTADWERTLRWAIALRPEHLSCYGLQLADGTPMMLDVAAGRARRNICRPPACWRGRPRRRWWRSTTCAFWPPRTSRRTRHGSASPAGACSTIHGARRTTAPSNTSRARRRCASCSRICRRRWTTPWRSPGAAA